MDTIADIASAFGTQQKMANEVGTTRGAVEQWCQRNTIPSRWLSSVVTAAKQNEIDLTAERLLEIVAASTGDASKAA